MKFRLLTAVWGTEFCDHFVRIAARSLLAAGNFPDLSRRHATAYTILTTEQDAAHIQRSPVFAALAASGQVELQTLRDDEIDPANPSSHWTMWGRGIEAAKKNGEVVVYIMPDIAYASGTLLDWARAFEQGYRCIFSPIPEVVLETTLGELEHAFPAESGLPLSLGVSEVTKLCIKHLHPYHLCMLRNSRRWVVHPESVGYVIPGAGFVQRVMGSHPICFDPGFFEFNSVYTPTNCFDKIAFLPSTAVSLEPFLKFTSLYYRPWRMVGDRLSNSGWWFDYFTSHANDLESSRSYVFPSSGTWPVAAVARAHASGNFYRAQCLATRAVFHIWTKLGALGCSRAAEILATAHYAGRLRRHKLLSAPTTVLVPNNEAFERSGVTLAGGSNEERRRRLLDIVYSHCFAGHYRFEPGQSIVATAGGKISTATEGVRNDGEAAGTLVGGPFELGGFTVYVTDFVVKPRRSPAVHERTPASDARRSNGARTFGAGRDLIVVHPSFVGSSDSPSLSSELPRESAAVEWSRDQTALVNILQQRVKDTFAPQPAPNDGVEERKRLADERRARLGSSVLLGLRGRIRRLRKELDSLWSARRTSIAKAGKERIRELLLTDRLQEAESASVDSVQVWRELGGEFGAESRVELALYCRRRAAESSPDDLQWRLEWVRELLLAGRLEEAESAGRGMTQLWRILGGGFPSEGEHELGLYCRRRAVESNPVDLQVRQELIRELLLAGRFEEANAADGGLLRPWRILGNGLAAEGQHDLALYCRRRAADVDPSDVQARKELVRDLLIAGRVQEANAASAGFRPLWRELAGELAAQGNLELNRYCLDQARGSTPAGSEDPSERLFRKIQIEIGVLALRDLLQGYSEEIGSSPADRSNGSPSPLERLEAFLAGAQRRPDPLNGLAKLLEQHPDFAEAWVEKAFIHLEAGQIVLAVDAALRALRARPRCLRAAHNPHPQAEAAGLVGTCLETAGLLEQAIAAYRTCVSIDEGALFIRIRLGRLLWRQGSVDEAMQEFMKAMPFSGQIANFPDLPRRIEKLSLD